MRAVLPIDVQSRKRAASTAQKTTQSRIGFPAAPKPNELVLSDGELKALAHCVFRWAMLTNASARSLHHPAFKDIFQPMIRNFSLPSRQALLSSALDLVYQQAMRTVRETLQPALRSFSLCLDGWVSVRKHRYLGFVALTPARPVFLGCAMLPHSEDARSIKAATLNFLNSDVFRYTTSSDGATYEVDLRHKIDAIVSDRASAMLAAIRDTQECLLDDGINVAHTGFTSHGGNLLSQDILRHEYLAPAIQRARRLGKSLRNRTKACTYLDSVGLTRSQFNAQTANKVVTVQWAELTIKAGIQPAAPAASIPPAVPLTGEGGGEASGAGAAAAGRAASEVESTVERGADQAVSEPNPQLAEAVEADAGRARRAAQAKELVAIAGQRRAPRRRAQTLARAERVAKRRRMQRASEVASEARLVSSSTSAALVSPSDGTSAGDEVGRGDAGEEEEEEEVSEEEDEDVGPAREEAEEEEADEDERNDLVQLTRDLREDGFYNPHPPGQ